MATVELTKDNFSSTIDDNETVFIDFWADWCGPCKRFGPVFEEASTKHPEITFAKLDTDAEQELSMALDIQSIPTLMAFRKGYLVFREAGALNGKQFDSLIDQVQAMDIDALIEQAKAEQTKAEQETATN